MALARYRRDRGVDYWPGFVDALSTLVLGIIFLLTIFVVVQFFLSQEVSGKDTALAQLNRSPSFPLVPDTTSGTYSHAGTLRQGSAHHVRIIQAAGAPSVQLKLSGQSGGAISSTLVPRVGLVRIR